MLVRSEVFDVDAWVPTDLTHRRDQLDQLAAAVNPVFHDLHATAISFVGPSGTGKTATARYALRDMEQLGNIRTAFVDTWEQRTVSRTLYSVFAQVAGESGVHHPESPTADLLGSIRKAIRGPTVIVLDEVDMLERNHILTDLHEIRDLALVGIANQEVDCLQHIESRRVDFPPYTMNQVVDILEPRAKRAFRLGLRPDHS